MATAVFLGKYAVLSSDLVQDKLSGVIDTGLKGVGVDRHSRDDLAKFAAQAVALGGSGVSYVQLRNASSNVLTFAKQASPLTFKAEPGKLYSGIPIDAIKFKRPKLYNKSGIADPTVKPDASWKDSDILSVKDLNHPVPLLQEEVNQVKAWMKHRKWLLDLWDKQDISFSNQEIKNLLRAVKSQLRDHMQPKDLAGILKENRGVEILDSNGKVFKHLNEWQEAKNSMENALEAMLESLYKTKTNPAEAKLYKERISQISKMMDKYEKLSENINWQTKQKL
jgi:hypothetical protein